MWRASPRRTADTEDGASDGSESKLLIGSFETETKLHVEVKPQLNQQAYLVARSVLLGEAPILPGKINLFRDDSYIGQSHMPLLRPGEEQNLAFGVDDNVSVAHRSLKDKASEEGLIGKSRVLERQFVTEIINLHKKPFEVVLLQNTPVSKDENIKVVIDKGMTTSGYEVDTDNIKGVMRWVQTLKPKEQKDITLGWKVMWPDGQVVDGL